MLYRITAVSLYRVGIGETGGEYPGIRGSETLAPANSRIGGAAGGEHWFIGVRASVNMPSGGQVLVTLPTVPADPTVVHGRDGSAAKVSACEKGALVPHKIKTRMAMR